MVFRILNTRATDHISSKANIRMPLVVSSINGRWGLSQQSLFSREGRCERYSPCRTGHAAYCLYFWFWSRLFFPEQISVTLAWTNHISIARHMLRYVFYNKCCRDAAKTSMRPLLGRCARGNGDRARFPQKFDVFCPCSKLAPTLEPFRFLS